METRETTGIANASRKHVNQKMEIIGLDIGGTKCVVFKSDETGTINDEVRFDTGNFEDTYARLFSTIGSLNPGRTPVFGISCGGPLDSTAGVIQSPPNLHGWDHVPIVAELEQRFGGSAFLMNDANACALAEWQFGAGKGSRNMVFLTHGTGMGGGLILNGRLYEGTTGDAGEIGHIRLADTGPLGYGKAGSFEGFCSGGGLTRFAAMRGLPFRSGREIADAAKEGNAAALELLDESARHLGAALSILVDILNPEIIVLGSIFGRCRELLEPGMNEVLSREALPRSLKACRIVPAVLGERIGHFGAIATALYRLQLSQ